MKTKKYISLIAVAIFAVSTLFLSCKGKEPDNPAVKPDEMTWKIPVASNYEFSMTYITHLAFPEGVSKNTETTLGAFKGEECRGLAKIQQEGELYLCFLTIFSNEVSGEQIEIKAFDAAEKKIYNNCKTITFTSGSSLGSENEILHCK